MNQYRLRLTLTGYETHFLRENLKTYLETIQRSSPQTVFDVPHLEPSHTILQITSMETTNISAFELFPFRVDLIQDFDPPRVYFKASFRVLAALWSSATHIRHPFQPDHCAGTILPLSTTTGYLSVPSKYPVHQRQPIEIATLTLHSTFESLTYSPNPFEHYRQFEIKQGFLSLLDTADLNITAPDIFNPPPPPSASTRIGYGPCLLYTSPSPRDRTRSRMPSSA